MSQPPNVPPPRYAPPPRRRSPIAPWIIIAVAGGLLLLVLGTVGVARGWDRFVQFGICSDLVDYRKLVTRSDLAESRKAALREKLDRLRDRVHRGELRPSFLRWTEHDQVIRELLEGGKVSDQELRDLEQELGRIEDDG